MNDLILPESYDVEEVFTQGGLDGLLAEIETKARAIPRDISTEDGRKIIRSAAYALARSKTQLDNGGKDLVAGVKKRLTAIDQERSRAWKFLEQLQSEIRQPLTDYEYAEKARIEAHKQAMDRAERLLFATSIETKKELQEKLSQMQEIENRAWEEFAKEASQRIERVKSGLAHRLSAAQKAEAERAELEKLRAERVEIERLREEKAVAQMQPQQPTIAPTQPIPAIDSSPAAMGEPGVPTTAHKPSLAINDLAARQREAQSRGAEIREEKAINRLHAELERFLLSAMTVQRENSAEWMTNFAADCTAAARALNKNIRFVVKSGAIAIIQENNQCSE
ncbi:MAG: hypothetical protein Q8O94_03135 [bacterium]|nr:hypothetical protein [bacterium]